MGFDIQGCFFDYDDTAVVHCNRDRFSDRMSTKNLLTHTSEYCYGGSIIPPKMLAFIDGLLKRGVPCWYISKTHDLRIKAKEEVVCKYYGSYFKEGVYAAQSNEDKVYIAKTLADVNNLDIGRCIFVDDNPDILELMDGAGLIPISSVEILANPDILNFDTYEFMSRKVEE